MWGLRRTGISVSTSTAAAGCVKVASLTDSAPAVSNPPPVHSNVGLHWTHRPVEQHTWVPAFSCPAKDVCTPALDGVRTRLSYNGNLPASHTTVVSPLCLPCTGPRSCPCPLSLPSVEVSRRSMTAFRMPRLGYVFASCVSTQAYEYTGAKSEKKLRPMHGRLNDSIISMRTGSPGSVFLLLVADRPGWRRGGSLECPQ